MATVPFPEGLTFPVPRTELNVDREPVALGVALSTGLEVGGN